MCLDVGSTFTKASLVDLAAARVVAAAAHPTTSVTDVLEGIDACRRDLAAQDPRAADAEVLACSSAGGGLRIAVVGNEALVTAEAGRRVALSSGGSVVAVRSVATGDDLADLLAARPDVVLLTGGTDEGNEEMLLHATRRLVAVGWRGPVVVAGNVAAGARVGALLGSTPYVLADNVVPRIGVLTPGSARAAVRAVFLTHVIGGKHLSASADFPAMVRGATPDVVLRAVQLLARGLAEDRPGVGDVVVVDVGGATTDVHSAVELDPELRVLAREVVAPTELTRTVEGDLGMRASALSTVRSGGAEGALVDAARTRRDHPAYLPGTPVEQDHEEAIAGVACRLAVQRHAGRSRVVVEPGGRVVERSGVDLRAVSLVVASGGVFRHGPPGAVRRVLAGSVGPRPGGWQLPEAPRVVVDQACLLAAAGLLVEDHPDVAYRLVRRLLTEPDR